MDGLILAIDLGKFNSVCCWYDTTSVWALCRASAASRVTITPLLPLWERGLGGEGHPLAEAAPAPQPGRPARTLNSWAQSTPAISYPAPAVPGRCGRTGR